MVDVCLVLENTYPHVTGGVSRWVHDLTTGLPELSFAIAHLHEDGVESGPSRYAPPANVAPIVKVGLDPTRLGASPQAGAQLPEARVYHALSTGLASATGASAGAARNRPFVLTEHGLAWLEARLGIEGCKPTPKGGADKPVRLAERRRLAALRAAAIDQMAGQAYGRADAITTVCRANAERQRRRGAPPERSSVIANPVGVAADAERRPQALRAPTIGLVGRVVPIKDLSTFIRACRAVADELPAARFVVVGPLDHDPAYADRCQALAADLDLAERLQFTGETDPRPWYSSLDVAVLTSVSEAQPLCLIEAMAAGVPVVSTAIGGCADLVRGDREPVEAGRAGLLTPTRDPAATAGAVLRLCRDPQLRWRLSRAGQARARASHNPERFLAAYRALYELAIDQPPRAAAR